MVVDTQEQLYHGHLVTGHPCAFQDSMYINDRVAYKITRKLITVGC